MKYEITGQGEEVVLLSAGRGGAAAFWAPQTSMASHWLLGSKAATTLRSP